MKNRIRINILSVAVISLLVSGLPGLAMAQVPVTDTTSTGKTIKQWFTEVKESKTVVSTMQTVEKTKAAIGTAKSTVSEYVIANKKKIEAKLKKVKEYKEKAEKYKKKYEKYKAQLDENIAKAKKLKAQAEELRDQAKEAVAAAKSVAGAAVDKAQSITGAGNNQTTPTPAEPAAEATEPTPEDTATTTAPEEDNAAEIVSPSDSLEPTTPAIRRKAFTTSALHRKDTLVFAQLDVSLPDGGTDANGTVMIPESMAMFCGLNSKDALEPGKVHDCLLKINAERTGAQSYSGSDAPKVYNRAVQQYVAASIAEAYKARQEADSFEEKFIEPVEFAPELTSSDVYANLVELNKAVDMQMNGLLKVFSTQLVAQSLIKYGDYNFVAETDDEDEADNAE